MKNLFLFAFAALLLAGTAAAQTVLINEDFESGPYEFTSAGTNNWAVNSRVQAFGSYSDSCTVGFSGAQSTFTSAVFSTIGFPNVLLEFSHICKTSPQDSAKIQYSLNGGTTWITIDSSFRTGTDVMSNNSFSETSYPDDWQYVGSSTPPENTWWKNESFNLGSILGNQPSVMIRFKLKDGGTSGSQGRAGWFLDNIKLTAAISELTPPAIIQQAVIWQDTVYGTGPFQINASITDASNIDTAYLIYAINSAPYDTVAMLHVSGNNYSGNIPSQGYLTHVDYYITAIDASLSHNAASTTQKWFYNKKAPPSVIIGTGTSNNYNNPVNGLYNYSWSESVYGKTDINYIGFIDSVSYQVASVTAPYTFSNQKVFFSVNSVTEFPSATMPDTSTMTKVFDGDFIVTATGWQKLPLSAPFFYNGNSNLHIVWINNDGSYTSGYPYFNYTSTTPLYKSKYQYATSSFPTTEGYLTLNRPNLKIIFQENNSVHDAGATTITEPLTSTIPITGTPYDVKVLIRNFGSDTLNNAQINWTLNGNPQAPYAWSGTLLQDQSSTDITIGSVTFPMGGSNTIKVWTSLPDGFADETGFNDTTAISYFVCDAQLAGNYTINPVQPTSGTNFHTFSEVLMALENCGISDTTVFQIVNGTYDTLLNIPKIIPGIGSGAIVGFESLSGNPADVTLQNTASGISNNYVFNLDSASYIQIKNLTIKALGSSYGRCIQIANGCSEILIENNILIGATTTSTGSELAVINNSSAAKDSNIVVINNQILNGSYGLYWYGLSSSALETGNVIESNTITNYYNTGIFSYYQNGIVIRGNNISTLSAYSSSIGMSLNYNDFAIIEANKIAQPQYYGLYLNYCDGTGSALGKVVNNFVSVGGTASSYGIYTYYTTYFDIFHNSVNCYSTGTSGSALYYSYSSANNTLNNNIFANTGGGYSFYSNSSTFTSNYNDLYTTGTNLGYYNSTNSTNLAAWLTATSQDGNSKSINPAFFGNTDLHTIVPGLNNQGTPLGIMTDIDGDARSFGVPDIGADEYAPLAGEASVIAASSPVGGCTLNSELVTITIKNNGYNAINGNLNASYIVDAQAPVTEPVATTIPAGGSIVFTFATPAILTTGATDTDFDFTVYVDLIGDPIKYNDTLRYTVTSLHSAAPVTVSNGTTLYGTSTTLTAVSTDSIQWYSDAALTNLLHAGSSFTTPILFDTTVYYVASTTGFEYNYTFDTDLQGWTASTPCASYTTYNWAWDSDGGNGTAYMIDPTTYSSSILKSPTIAVFGDEINFSYRHKYGTESCCDKGYVAYRIDGGSWTHFTPTTGAYNTDAGLNTDPLLASCTYGPTVGVYAGTGAYSTASGVIPLNGGSQIEIAFVFSSDVSAGGTGWFIDNVSLVKSGCPGDVKEDTVFVTGIPANDLGVVSILQPVSGVELTTSPVEVEVTNFGTSPASGFTISYSINGGTPVNEVYTGTLNVGQTINYTFSQDANLTAYATYNFKAYTTYGGDVTAVNDTAYKTIVNSMLVYCTSAATSTGYEDLTGLSIGTTSYTNPAIGSMYTDYTGLAPFILAPGQSYSIGVSSDFAPGYTYSYSCWVKVFIDYNHDGDFEDAAEQVFSSATTSSNTVTGSFTIPTTTYNGITLLRVVFQESGSASTTEPCGTYSWGETEDYLVTLMTPIPEDAGVTSIVSPDYIQSEGSSVPVIVNVYNHGTTTLTSIPVEYIANGAAPVSFTWSGTLDPGQTTQITLPSVTVLPDSNHICAYTVVLGDSNTFNDESCSQFFGLPPFAMLDDDMENGTLFYTDAPTLWQHGVPTASTINSAHSPDSVWATVLAGNYPNSASGYIYTPTMSFIGVTGAYLTFYYWIHAQENLDGGFVEYSVNNGTTWASLGSIDDPNGYNWFNSTIVSTPGWSQNTGGWVPAFIKLDAVAGYSAVKFRFGFKSNTTTTFNGFALDDIKILSPPTPINAGVVEILTPSNSTAVGTQITVSVRIKNFGTNTLTSIPLTYLCNTGFPPQSGTWSGNLLPDDTTSFTFTQKYPGPSSNYRLCAYTTLSGDPYTLDDSTCVDLTLVGIENMTQNGVVLMQNNPNPTSTQTEISFTLPEPGNCVITLRNTIGEQILSTQLSGQTGKNTFNFDASNLEQGIYFYTLEYKDVVLTRRFSVMR